MVQSLKQGPYIRTRVSQHRGLLEMSGFRVTIPNRAHRGPEQVAVSTGATSQSHTKAARCFTAERSPKREKSLEGSPNLVEKPQEPGRGNPVA